MSEIAEILEMYTRQRKYLFYLMAIFVLGWGFTSYKAVFLGLTFGTCISLFNLFILVRKMKQFGNTMKNGGKMRSLGMLSRMAAAIFAVLIAMEFPEYLHLVSVIIGLMTAYLVIMIDYFFQHYFLHK